MKAIIAVVAVVFIAGYLLGGMLYSKTVTVYEKTTEEPRAVFEPYGMNASRNPNMTFATVIVPAVDQDGKGVATRLDVQVVPGSGKALVNIDKLLFWVDTQSSIRTARSVAENVMGINLSKTDIVYTITANASVVEGPSAGAALTVATIAALQGRQTNRSVMMTGTINQDGTIGPIGGVLEKAKAAKEIGAALFLVPAGQSVEVSYESRRHCEKVGWAEYCTIETVPSKKDVALETGIEVVEVDSITDALEYFLV